MTGFGKAIVKLPNKKVSIEIKSLNSKQLNLNVRIPAVFREKEVEIRDLLFQTVERGKVDFVICIEYTDMKISSQINKDSVGSYFSQVREIAESLNIPFSLDCLPMILSLPGIIETKFVELSEIEWKTIKQAIQEALNAFTEFRLQEGVMLKIIFRNKIRAIGSFLQEIDKYESERIEKIRTKLIESIKQIGILSYDENRLEQEMVYYIERLDISEEKARLKNHIEYFLETVEKEKSQGCKLGFIAQEIGREINTLGAKSNHIEMQKIVVQMKDELEQIKEQVQNVL
ncbi:MAG: YicC family protein [Candidatus Azobacteroides pseudotrichonymphae]|nr:MAG: YicC family protein [Candidatus Azobacteroides pseudotrichonymphae]